MAENLKLKNTIQINDAEYDINAKYSDEAGKVTNFLTVKESGEKIFDFDGSTSGQTIDYVSAEKGGTFNNPVYLSNPTTEPDDNEVITSGQINNRIVDLNGAPICLWDTSYTPTDISSSLYMLKDSDDKAYKFTTITGTESDFYLLKDALKGDFDLVSQDLTYDIINYLALSFGWKTGQLASTASGVIVVPNEYTGKYFKPNPSGIGNIQSSEPTTQKVAEIAASTFRNNKKITSVVLPETISIIGSGAFYGCTNLKSVIIPNSVRSVTEASTTATTVESWFDGCTNLRRVVFTEGEADDFTDIGYALFRNCTSLTSIVIPKYVKTIGKEAFINCSSLSSIVIPASVTSIADDAFANCTNLSTIYYTGSSEQWENISISDTGTYGNNALLSATKVYDYVVTGQPLEDAPSGSIDINEIGKGPFIYICKEEESADTPASNKIFLKLPGDDNIVEVSKGAARLETPKDAKVSGYYTYETLAAIIAGINARLDGLGGETLKLPTTVPTTGSVIIPEELHTEILQDTFDPTSVPTVQELQEEIEAIKGGDGDSLASIRADLNDLIAEVTYELEQNPDNPIFAANSRIDALENFLNSKRRTQIANFLDSIEFE